MSADLGTTSLNMWCILLLQGNTPDPHNTPPSRVVHARAVPDGCTHQQMIANLTKFGKIS